MVSIRRNLLEVVLSAFLVIWLLIGLLTYVRARHEVEELFDAQLAQAARVLDGLTHDPASRTMPSLAGNDGDGHRYEKKIAFQIWRENRLIMRSPNMPEAPLSLKAGFSDRWMDGEQWRIFHLASDDNGHAIQVGESYRVRNELTDRILLQVLLPLLVALPLLGWVLWHLIGRQLSFLSRISHEIAGLSCRQLTPIAPSGPQEIQPLLSAINEMMSRVDRTLERERRFTADAAHELRTPLASLRIQAQVAVRARNDAERDNALKQILVGCDRATHLVAQLLTLARLEPNITEKGTAIVSLETPLKQVLGELVHLALEKQIDISLEEIDPPFRIVGEEAMLAILFRNLLDNAIRYVPQGGRIQAVLQGGESGVLFRLEDSGPGIPEAERETLLQPFKRGAATDSYGCGLGLSIVARIAKLHEAELVLGDSAGLGGLSISLRFPV
ncbi:MAG: sensor histidine kinase N-terminal domain-containing protein [Magnetococcales bacterium]|nr:sensor histidine kinase N-terminal domain-containing protein [Magnetococcales bacterium]